MNPLRHLPNLLTCGNLVCGCLALLMLPDRPLEVAAYFVWAACIFDFLDGFAARLLVVSSPTGKELDSLADMVSFGVVPAFVMQRLLLSDFSSMAITSLALLLAVFSALRLARFNVDENQKDAFIGLPTPANALFITSLVFLPTPLLSVVTEGWVLLAITFVFSLLLVAPFELFALKFKNFSWVDNRMRFTFIGAAVLLLALLRAGAIPLIILLYISASLINRSVKVHKN